jgi:hypothetical protein
MDNYRHLINKLDSIKDDTTEIKIEQAIQGKDIEQNKKNLEEHMRRTELAEEAIKLNTDKILKIESRTLWTWLRENAKTVIAVATIGGLLTGALEWLIIYFSQ